MLSFIEKNYCAIVVLLLLVLSVIESSSAFTTTTTTATTNSKSTLESRTSFILHEEIRSSRLLLAAAVTDPVIVNGDVNGSTPSSPPKATTKTNNDDDDSSETSDKIIIPHSQKTLLDKNDVEDDKDIPIFDNLAARAAICLYESELRRDAKGEHTKLVATSVTNWINDATAFTLQKTFDKVKLKLAEERTGLDRDEASAWIRWMKSSPTPMIVDFSNDIRRIANETITDEQIEWSDISREEFLGRLGCRLLLFPSGSALSIPLVEPPASVIYGKLLYGGVTRYRQLVSSNSQLKKPRRAGESTEIKTLATENIPVWMQYGGTERMYEAVDMGPAAVLEVMVLPRGYSLEEHSRGGGDMIVQNFLWKPQQIFDMVQDKTTKTTKTGDGTDEIDFVTGYTPISQSGKDRNDAFETDFKTSVGGLQKQIDAIVRRVLDGRVIRPAQEDDNNVEEDETSTALAAAALEAEELAVLGLTPVKGLLLYGPPGTGKTLLARQIARALRARAPKIVSAPELLDRWVGGSEKLVRGLFAEAEAELAACGGDATKSALHVVVIDEIDAVFRKRSSAEDSGEATRASVVNQILAKLDGVDTINNILLIGMTNRRELLDSALLRPGRLEVQIEVPLPDKEGRREILQIHFDALRKKGRLSKPLCCAIDGVPYIPSLRQGLSIEETSDSSSSSSSGGEVKRERKRDSLKRAAKVVWSQASSAVRPSYDLAAESNTGGFSGADIAGLVRCAGSLALSRARKDGNGVDGLLITLEDVKQALLEVSPD